MASKVSILVAVLSIAAISFEIPGSAADSDTGVCTVQLSKYVTVTQSQQVVVYYTSETWCWSVWELFRCDETLSKYSTTYSTGSQLIYYLSMTCCPGYQEETSSPLICHPTCENECLHGECTSPDSCTCDTGWTGESCSTDDDECAVLNGGCSHNCTNINGSYYCSCPTGYSLSSDNHICQDIPECSNGVANCSQICSETPGSYECNCSSGYSLDGNGYTCSDINECATSNGGCQHGCVNIPGSYNCSCDTGYFLLEDGSSCSDHNECVLQGQCDHVCHNLQGSYYCSCYTDGYRIGNDNYTCIDIDECAEGTDGCDHICNNTEGSFLCSCQPGFYLLDNNKICADNDECAIGNGGCEHVCINNVGTYHCECQDGYTLGPDKSSCIGDPCVVLTDPSNGYITCNGEQVTNTSCTFSCLPGHSVMGSATRTCLPDHTWDGEEASCPIMKCDELKGSEIVLVIQPCNREYQSVCSILCKDGYQVNTSITGWTQRCILTTNGDNVHWTQPSICIEKPPCVPDPCNGGQCIVTIQGTERCDCSGALLTGQYCELWTLQTPAITILTEGQISNDIILETQSGKSIEIVVSSNNGILQLNQNQAEVSLELPADTGKATFSIIPREKGLYSLSYSLRTNSPTVTPEDSAVLVLPNGASEHSTNNYFTSLHLAPGELAVGCCEYDYLLPMSVCPSDLMLKSSCTWTTPPTGDVIASTGGVVFIISRNVALPLSIAGVQLLLSLSTSQAGIVGIGTNEDLQTCTARCQPSDRLSHQTCSVTDSSVRFDEYDMQDMLEQNSLAFTFVREIMSFLPSWLLTEVLTDLNDNKYTSYDFKAYFGYQQDIQNLKGCDRLISTSATAMYALRMDASLQITIDRSSFAIISSAEDPLCFIVDICNPVKPNLIAPFPPELAKISYMEKLAVKGWEIQPTSITFAEYGISKAEKFPYRQFWDGHEYLKISLPSYDFEMGVGFRGSLSGGDLSVDLAFHGSVLYKANPIGNQVPGLLFGDTHLRLMVPLGQEQFTLLLTGNNQPTLFTYPGTSAKENSPISSGMSMKLSYQHETNKDSMFFKNLLKVPDFTSSCPIDTYIFLTELLDVQQVSLRSNCIELQIGKLVFPSGLDLTLLLPGTMTSSATPTGSLTILTNISSSTVLKVGDLFTLIPGNEVALVNISYRSADEFSGTISHANITVFDSQLTTSIKVYNSKLTFHGKTNIFSSFDVSVSGSFSSTSGNWNDVTVDEQIVFLTGESSFQANLSDYLSQYMKDVVKTILSRRQLANESAITAQTQFVAIENNLSVIQDQLSLLDKEYSSALLQKEISENVTIESQASFSEALKELSINKDTLIVCQEQACEHQCMAGFSCATCHIQTPLTEMGTCMKDEIYNKSVRVSDVVMGTQSGYHTQCKPCWGVQRQGYYFLPWKVECCETVSIPYITHKLDYHDEVVSVVEGIEKPCIVEVHEQSLPVQCCQNVPCTTHIENPNCIAANSHCSNMQRASLLQVDEELAKLYANVYQANINYTISELKVAEIEYQLSVIEQEAKLLQTAYESAHMTTNITYGNLQAVMKQTEEYDILTQLLSIYSDPMEVIHISKLSFNVSIANETPIVIPILVAYDTPYTNQSYQTSVVVNFERNTEFILKTIAKEILEHFMLMSSTGFSKWRRDSQSQTFSDFQQKCVALQNVKSYFSQLSNSLNITAAAVEAGKEVMAEVTSNIPSLATFNLTKDESMDEELMAYITAYTTFIENSMSSIAQVASDLEDRAIFMWQGTNELLHTNSYTVGGEACIGFTDCLHSALGLTEKLLRETSDKDSNLLLSEFLSFKNEALEVSYIRTLVTGEAQMRLLMIIESISALESLDYWCDIAPKIISQPLAEVNVSKGATFSIECKAQSKLPLHYQWNKDGVLISGQKWRKLVITNMQMVDAGEYSCSAISDAGTVVSLKTVVNVYYAPVFNRTLETAQVYEGNDNGTTLACDAHSQPSPAWTWSYRMSPADNWQQIEGVATNVLTISNPQQKNEGWYNCTATNWGGSTSEVAYLTVLKASVVRIKYPVSFDLSVYSANSKAIDPQQLEAELVSTLPSILNADTIEIKELSTVIEDSVLTVSFDLITPSISYTQDDSIENIAIMTNTELLELEQVKQSLVSVMNSKNGLELNLSEVTLSSVPDSLLIFARVFVCPIGFGLDSSSLLFCVSCPPGSYQGPLAVWNTDIGGGEYVKEEVPQCFPCPNGYYQSLKESIECLACPEHSSTLTVGSVSSSDCLAMCHPGTYSESGLAPCEDCPPHYFQLIYGSTSCEPCTDDTDAVANCVTSTTAFHSESRMPSPSAETLKIEGGYLTVVIGTVIGVVVTLIIIILISLLTVVACKRITKRQLVKLQNQDGDVQLNNYDDASIATGLSEAREMMGMNELKEKELNGTFSTSKDPIYDTVDQISPSILIPHQEVTPTQLPPELPRPRSSPLSSLPTLTSQVLPQNEPAVSDYVEPLPPLITLSSASPYSDPNAKPYSVPVIRRYEEIGNSVDTQEGAVPYYQQSPSHPECDNDEEENGYMEMRGEEQSYFTAN